ncbi:MAG: hypothetical protein NXY57DRAFT_79559 [Lentinula lateritia]|nr:MAG: hypothetical protein NXY57DRAFT_79559 [Lentinula lateritia]
MRLIQLITERHSRSCIALSKRLVGYESEQFQSLSNSCCSCCPLIIGLLILFFPALLIKHLHVAAVSPSSFKTRLTLTFSTYNDSSAMQADVEHTYKFDMTCSGCSGAVTRVLDKAKRDGAVGEFSVNLETQEVIVKSTQPYEDIHAKIKKTGKEVRSGEILV